MYSGTSFAPNQLAMRIYSRTPGLTDIEGLTVVHAQRAAASDFEAWAATRLDGYTTFDVRVDDSRAFAMMHHLTPERALLEFLAWEGPRRVEAFTRGLDSFQLTDPELELDALVPVATDPLRELLCAGFDLLEHEDAQLRLRRPLGLDALMLAARWRY